MTRPWVSKDKRGLPGRKGRRPLWAEETVLGGGKELCMLGVHNAVNLLWLEREMLLGRGGDRGKWGPAPLFWASQLSDTRFHRRHWLPTVVTRLCVGWGTSDCPGDGIWLLHRPGGTHDCTVKSSPFPTRDTGCCVRIDVQSQGSLTRWPNFGGWGAPVFILRMNS